jgi:hypothetical protein
VLWIRSLGPLCRSVGLLKGRVHLSGTSGTLASGDPWVPMSLKSSLHLQHEEWTCALPSMDSHVMIDAGQSNVLDHITLHPCPFKIVSLLCPFL